MMMCCGMRVKSFPKYHDFALTLYGYNWYGFDVLVSDLFWGVYRTTCKNVLQHCEEISFHLGMQQNLISILF
jgi:hypothetical protein